MTIKFFNKYKIFLIIFLSGAPGCCIFHYEALIASQAIGLYSVSKSTLWVLRILRNGITSYTSPWCRSLCHFFIHNLENIVKADDNLNLQPTENLIKQTTQIYSRNNNVCPTITQVKRQSTQTEGLFAIAYAAGLLCLNNPAEMIDNQI